MQWKHPGKAAHRDSAQHSRGRTMKTCLLPLPLNSKQKGHLPPPLLWGSRVQAFFKLICHFPPGSPYREAPHPSSAHLRHAIAQPKKPQWQGRAGFRAQSIEQRSQKISVCWMVGGENCWAYRLQRYLGIYRRKWTSSQQLRPNKE